MLRKISTPGSARWIALVVVCFGQLMSLVDATIVNVSLPSIQRSLHFSQANLTWVVNGYLISYGSLLLLAGRVGDLIGRRRVFLSGIALFTFASAVCGFATSEAMLVVARFVQGIGGAGATSAIVAIIATEFPEPRERAMAMSVYTFVISGGASLGLLAGGAITQSLDWHWIFFINLPIGVATFVLGRKWIRENQGLGVGRNVDVLGSVLVTAAMMVLAYAIVTSSSFGWGSAHTLAFAGIALALLASFIVLEMRIKNPIVPLRIFAVPGLAASSVIRGFLITGMYASFFIGVLYLQHVRGYGVLETGLAFLPQTLMLALLSSGPTARLVGRFGPRAPLLAGLLAATVGLVLLTQVGSGTAYLPQIGLALMLLGAGAGLAFMPLLTIAMQDVPNADAGLASGIVNTSLQLSAALAVAVLGTIAATHTRALTALGDGHLTALLGGYHLAFVIAAASVAAGVVMAFVLLPAQRRERFAPEAVPEAEAA